MTHYNGAMDPYNGAMDHYNGTMDHYNGTAVQWLTELFAKLSTRREKQRQQLSTDFLSWCCNLLDNIGILSDTKGYSSSDTERQLFAATLRAERYRK